MLPRGRAAHHSARVGHPQIDGGANDAAGRDPNDAAQPPGGWRVWLRAHAVRWFWPTIATAGLWLALSVLHGELHTLSYRHIVAATHAIPADRLAWAVVLTALSYAVLPAYDALALHYARRPIPLRRLGFGSFVAYAMSHTLGFPMLTGGTVRYRFWSAWGLSTADIARAAAFSSATFGMGLMMVGGLAFLIESRGSAHLIGLPPWLLKPTGLALLAPVILYLGWSARRQAPIRLLGWEFPVPHPRMALSQLALAALDWAVAGSVLYVLLPEAARPPLLSFLSAFMIAQLGALISHVPGGIGVFETLMVLLLEPNLPTTPMLGVLIVYRIIYYLMPFAVGLVLLVGYEVRHRQDRFLAAAQRTGAVVQRAGRWVPALLPRTLGAAVFAAGCVLVLSGAMPAVHPRIRLLTDVTSLGVVEVSHVAASMIGAALVVLGWGLSHRLDAAFGLTCALLTAGIAAALLRGLDWEEALILTTVLALLLPCRAAFHRRAALISEPFTPSWVAALIVVLGVTAWIGMLAYRHVDYSNALWLHFSAHGDAARFLRATLGASVVLFAFALFRLFRYAPADPRLPDVTAMERARGAVARSRCVMAGLALLGDKSLLFSESGNTFLMYAVAGRSWVALGDPVGPAEEWSELAWRFREAAHRHGAWSVFYQVSAAALPLCIDLGLTLIKLGEEARVPLHDFSLEGGGSRKTLRRRCRELEKLGARFEIVEIPDVPRWLPQLRRISDAWLKSKRTREKAFSLGRFDDAYLVNFPLAIVRIGDQPVAFANVWRGADAEELSIDLMRYTPDAPHGVMDYLIVELMNWGRSQGFRWFNLGMAPLAGLENRALAPLWTRLGALAFHLGEHFYNFQGLRGYKQKFDPEWRPRYLASPGGLVLPRILANIATLISGGWRGLAAK